MSGSDYRHSSDVSKVTVLLLFFNVSYIRVGPAINLLDEDNPLISGFQTSSGGFWRLLTIRELEMFFFKFVVKSEDISSQSSCEGNDDKDVILLNIKILFVIFLHLWLVCWTYLLCCVTANVFSFITNLIQPLPMTHSVILYSSRKFLFFVVPYWGSGAADRLYFNVCLFAFHLFGGGQSELWVKTEPDAELCVQQIQI